MGHMALFSRTTNPAVDDYRTHGNGPRRKPMATATGPRVDPLAYDDHLAIRFADQPWRRIGWRQVRQGGWRYEAAEMHWRLIDGTVERFQLADEGRFPEVFRERVQASIVVEAQYESPTGGAVLVSARRDLGAHDAPLIWSAIPVQGAKADDPVVRDLAAKALAQLRADYDLA